MRDIKNCKICGKEFTPTTNRQLCCSKECSKKNNIELVKANKRKQTKHHKGEVITTNCLVCGKEFTYTLYNSEKKICSVNCYQKNTARKSRSYCEDKAGGKAKNTSIPFDFDYGKAQANKYPVRIERKWVYDSNGNVVNV